MLPEEIKNKIDAAFDNKPEVEVIGKAKEPDVTPHYIDMLQRKDALRLAYDLAIKTLPKDWELVEHASQMNFLKNIFVVAKHNLHYITTGEIPDVR